MREPPEGEFLTDAQSLDDDVENKQTLETRKRNGSEVFGNSTQADRMKESLDRTMEPWDGWQVRVIVKSWSEVFHKRQMIALVDYS